MSGKADSLSQQETVQSLIGIGDRALLAIAEKVEFVVEDTAHVDAADSVISAATPGIQDTHAADQNVRANNK